MTSERISADELRQILLYSPDTGEFHWIRKDKKRTKPNRRAGTVSYLGYCVIRYRGKTYGCHALAWLYMTGEYPSMQIDHIDGDKANNRWNNLRHVSQAVNKQNIRRARANNKTGLLGVCWVPRLGKFHAQIQVGPCKPKLGFFDTAEEAHDAYLKAKRILHDGCTI